MTQRKYCITPSIRCFFPLLALALFFSRPSKAGVPIVNISSLVHIELHRNSILCDGPIDAGLVEEGNVAAQRIDAALREYGVFVAIGHNISRQLHDDCFHAAKELFSINEVEKNENAVDHVKHFGRGYLGFGKESGLSEFFEPKEGYSYGQALKLILAPSTSMNEEHQSLDKDSLTGKVGQNRTQQLLFSTVPQSGPTTITNNSSGTHPSGARNTRNTNRLSSDNIWPSSLSKKAKDDLEDLYDEKVRVSKTIIGALASSFNCDAATQPLEQATVGMPTGTGTKTVAPNTAAASTVSDNDSVDSSNRCGNAFRLGANRTSSQDPGDLRDLCDGSEEISVMRLFHYFGAASPQVQAYLNGINALPTENSAAQATTPRPRVRKLIGSSPHTDWGFLTLIMADNIKGLQFLNDADKATTAISDSAGHQEQFNNKSSRSSHARQQPRDHHIAAEQDDASSDQDLDGRRWVDVPHVPGGLVVNGGDYLSLVSRGIYRSPIHRVLSPAEEYLKSSPEPSEAADSLGFDSVTDCEPFAKCSSDSSSDSSSGSSSGSSGSSQDKDRTSFVFFFYPGYDSPLSDDALAHCHHFLSTDLSSSDPPVCAGYAAAAATAAATATTFSISKSNAPKTSPPTPTPADAERETPPRLSVQRDLKLNFNTLMSKTADTSGGAVAPDPLSAHSHATARTTTADKGTSDKSPGAAEKGIDERSRDNNDTVHAGHSRSSSANNLSDRRSDGSNGSNCSSIKFGDHIIQKWLGVFRG